MKMEMKDYMSLEIYQYDHGRSKFGKLFCDLL